MDCIEKRPGPLRVKFNSKRTPIKLCEVDNQFMGKRHWATLDNLSITKAPVWPVQHCPDSEVRPGEPEELAGIETGYSRVASGQPRRQ